ELQPPNLFFVVDFVMVVILTLVLAAVTRFRPRLWELLIYAFFLEQAFSHVRHLSLFSIALVPMTARLLGAAVGRSSEALRAWKPSPHLKTIPHMACLGVGIYLTAWVMINPLEGGQWTSP